MGCDRTFLYACALKEHTDYVHKKIYHHMCDHVGENGETCGKTCVSAGEMNKHKKKHNPKLKIPCTCCTRRFYDRRRLQEHMDFVAGIFNHICDHVDKNGEKCGYKCETAGILMNHNKTHDPELKIPCACCIRRFKLQSDLQNHMDYVAGIFHNVCDHIDDSGEKCGFKCEQVSSLRVHEKIHIRDAQRDMAPMKDHHVLETPHTVQRWE